MAAADRNAWVAAVGIDVGGTKIAAGVVDTSSGAVVERRRIPTCPERGGAAVRMKDRRTSVVSSWYLDEENRGWLEFSDYMQQPAVRRRTGLKGDESAP